MRRVIRKLAQHFSDRVLLGTGRAHRQFMAEQDGVRVLTYHGVVPDALADRSWMPSHYVTASQFDRQMEMLAEVAGPAQPLGEVIDTRAEGNDRTLPAVCITFDDGTADNLTLALPILRKHGHRATFFLATGYIGRPRLLIHDVIRLLRGLLKAGRLNARMSPVLRRVLSEPGFAKTQSVFSFGSELYALWNEWVDEVDPAAIEALAPMTWEGARILRAEGMELGAHTVTHVILAREKRRTRRNEILESIARVRSITGQYDVPFSYPNGDRGDYDAFDMDLLAAIRVPYAVTEQPGWNHADTPMLELRRQCIGLHHHEQAFLAELYGLHDSHEEVHAQPEAMVASA